MALHACGCSTLTGRALASKQHHRIHSLHSNAAHNMAPMMVWLPVLLLCCVAALPLTPSPSSIIPSAPLYTQCNASWANDPMGVDGAGERSTICGEGCAMSSASMALAALGIRAPWCAALCLCCLQSWRN